MPLSVFNLYIEEYPEAGSTLIYNTFSGGFGIVDATTLSLLRKADRGELSLAERTQLRDLPDLPDLYDSEVGILVDSRAAEEQAYREWHEAQRSVARELSAIVSTTFACNLDCSYCCQSDVLSGKTMTDLTAVAASSWLAARAREIGCEKVDIWFVGGEPLLHPSRIEQIARALRGQLPTGVDFTFGLITNGVFMTRDLVERWIPLGLRAAQVTLDGDETTHSVTRRSKKRGEDSFGVIFQNVVETAHLISITVNGNYQTDTVQGFVPLLHKLREAGLPQGSRVHFSPALTVLGAPSDSASGSCTWSGSSPELMIALSDEIRRSGFDAGDPIVLGPCAFHQKHHFAIDPEGHIYKCPGFLGHAEWAIGHVTTGLTARYEGLTHINPQRECGSCAHRPDCAGGCVAAEWLRVGRAEGVNCELGFFEGQKEHLVKRKYALTVAPDVREAIAMFPPSPQIPVAPKRRGQLGSLRVIV